MAYITKRGNSYSVRYTYEDEHGKVATNGKKFSHKKRRQQNRKKQIETNWQAEPRQFQPGVRIPQ